MDCIISGFSIVICTNINTLYIMRKNGTIRAKSPGTTEYRAVPNKAGMYSPPEKAMAPHSSTLAWRIPGTMEPGGLPSMGSHRVGHD